MDIMYTRHSILYFLICLLLTSGEVKGRQIHHYVYFNRDREHISDSSFLGTKAFEGAQLKYTWRELEPEKDRYNFSDIQKDLDFLSSNGKKRFIQLQDVSFDTSIINVPSYLLMDKEFHGGATHQIETAGNGQAVAVGWVARRWDPAVQGRLHKLFSALGSRIDGKIEGINLPETSVEFGENQRLFPQRFSFDHYRDAVITNMRALKKAFPSSVAMVYANSMPGE